MRPRLVVCDDPAERAATHIALAARASTERFHVAFSGGKTPWRMIDVLASLELPWARLWAWQVDERVAPAWSEDRNATQLYARLPSPACPQPIPVDPVRDPSGDDAARDYGGSLRDAADGVLHLVHLGLGDDGHIASLFPGDPQLCGEDCDVVAVGPHLGYRRVTLTYGALARAGELIFLVTGASKRVRLAQLLDGDPAIPAGRIRHSRCVVYADRTAAP